MADDDDDDTLLPLRNERLEYILLTYFSSQSSLSILAVPITQSAWPNALFVIYFPVNVQNEHYAVLKKTWK